MNILGLHVGHDRGACLLQDGKILVAISEERLDRIKYSPSSEIPYLSIQYCLNYVGLKEKDIDLVVFGYAKTEVKNIGKKIREKLRDRLKIPEDKIEFVTHHLAHLYSSFYLSPFEEAAALIIDGAGNKNVEEPREYLQQFTKDPECIESESGYYINKFEIKTLWKRWQKREGIKKKIICGEQISLGRLYWEACLFVGLGFFDAGKLMGMASYGENIYKDIEIIKKENGTIFVNDKWKEHFRPPKTFKQKTNIAYKIQKEIEEAIIYLVNNLYNQTKAKNLCMAGGVALNAVTNYLILKRTKFKNLFVPPHTNDTGIPIGCALYGYYKLKNGRKRYFLQNAYLGKAYTKEEIQLSILRYSNFIYARFYKEEKLVEKVAELLKNGKIVGWYKGEAEIGPRALGHRSILCDSRNPKMKDILNSKVKHREWYRPFAPSVLLEKAEEYFNLDRPSPFMLLIGEVKPDKKEIVPAITHIDGTARIQTVTEKEGSYYWLIRKFEELTGVPVILNTSFNLAGEPIVETPDDAINCFLRTQMDYLVLENWILRKKIWPLPVTIFRVKTWLNNVIGIKLIKSYKNLKLNFIKPLVKKVGLYPLYSFLKKAIHFSHKIIFEFPHRKTSWDISTEERAIPDKVPKRIMSFIKKRTMFAFRFINEKFTVLDAGCGSGWSCFIFSKKAKKVYGIDYSQEAIAYAEKNYKRDNISFLQMDIRDLKFQDNFFDMITCFEVIEHLSVEDGIKAISELYRVLKPGGVLIGTTPVISGEKGRDQCKIKYHVHEYSKKELHELLSKYFPIVHYPEIGGYTAFMCYK